jgi:hypothetical protein
MNINQWLIAALAAGLLAGSTQAAPLHVQAAPASEPRGIEAVQYYDDARPTGPRIRSNDLPSYDRNFDRSQRRGLYPQPQPRDYEFGRRFEDNDRSRRYEYGRPDFRDRERAYGYDPRSRKETMKDHIKEQRKLQKEIHKEQIRAWNRANGF